MLIACPSAKTTLMTDAQRAYEPSHPGLFEVAFAAGDYNSTLRAVKVQKIFDSIYISQAKLIGFIGL